MPEPLVVPRRAPAPVTASACTAGAAAVDLTPDPSLDMAGYSLMAKRGHGTLGRLFARALYLEDAAGHAVAFCTLDLMSASRYLLEAAAHRTAPRGIGVENLVLAGTHTHTGPGHFYGNTLYDHITARLRGFDAELAQWLAERIALAIEQAIDGKQPARVGVGVARVWGQSRCAPYWAFECNQRSDLWNTAGWPGEAPPAGLTDKQRATDPRVTVLAASTASDPEVPMAAFATFGCHPTALGHTFDLYSPDWPGFAVRRARSILGASTVVGLAGGPNGDQTPMREGDVPPRGPHLARIVGEAVGEAIAQAWSQAVRAPDYTVDARHCDWLPADREVDGDPATRLSEEWCLGIPSACGAEEAPSGIDLPGISNPRTDDSFDLSDPSFPKADARLIQDFAELLGLAPSPSHPLHLVRVGDHAFATVPGEPTVTTAWRLEQLLRAELGVGSASVIGYAGDYASYFTTLEEYRCQHYEASSTIYGRNQVNHLLALYRKLCSGWTACDESGHIGAFEPLDEPHAYAFLAPAGDARATPEDVEVVRDGRSVRVRWQLPRKTPMRLAEDGPVLLVLRDDGGAAVPWIVDALPFDEIHHLFEVRVEVVSHGVFGHRDQWTVAFELPAALPPGPLTVQVPRRASIEGFTHVIPGT